MFFEFDLPKGRSPKQDDDLLLPGDDIQFVPSVESNIISDAVKASEINRYLTIIFSLV